MVSPCAWWDAPSMAVEVSAMRAGVEREPGLHALSCRPGSPGPSVSLARRFPSDPSSIGAARRAVEELTLLGPAVIEDLRLLVSELVANSVEHSPQREGTPIGLTVSTLTRRVRVEVDDGGHGFAPTPSRPPVDAPSGRGLFLVDQLAASWGVSGPGGTRVWCELERERLNGGVDDVERSPEAPTTRTFAEVC